MDNQKSGSLFDIGFRALMEQSSEAVAIFDTDTGLFVDANTKALSLFGIEREALYHVGPLDVSPPTQPDGRSSDRVANEKIQHALAGGTPVFEWKYRNAAGNDIPCEKRLVQLPMAGRNLVCASITDISERLHIEQALIRLERLRALGEMSAGVSHNLNNILVGVLGPAQLLQEETDDPRTLRHVENIINSGRRAKDLVQRLYQAVRDKEEGALHQLLLNSAIQQSVIAAEPRWKDEAESRNISIEV